MLKTLYALLLLTLVLLLFTGASDAERWKVFETNYTSLCYIQSGDLNSFFWRISGADIDVYTYPGLAKSRIDRIVEKVQSLLDMYPENFRVDILLYPTYTEGPIACYSEEDKSISAYVDRITDGVLAHEISHAVMNAYFKFPPPKKMAEILSQYVDRNLWSE
ncbi:MAG: hypothetical protein ABID09_07465 [Candidatus Omnitrophota bacterium]